MIKGWKNNPEWVRYYEEKKAERMRRENFFDDINFHLKMIGKHDHHYRVIYDQEDLIK